MQTVKVKTKTETSINTKQIINDNDSDPLFERKIENATDGLSHDCFNWLEKVASNNRDNVMLIANYIASMKTEINLSNNYRRSIIILLSKFSLFFKNQKTFKSITREDVLSFLDSFRKIESVDPMHMWIGTYNTYRIHLMRFFKWLYFPDIEQDNRPKHSVIENIPKLKRKEKSIYKPTDLWTEEDDSLFLKYCPSKRIRCYHAISRDASARPHEILKLKIKDIVFKFTPDKKQYAEILLNGKTGSRHIPLFNSIPYIKDYLSHEHPQSGNPNAPLICGLDKSLGRPILEISLLTIYGKYKKGFFPKLLDNDSPNVPPEDKQKIRELLKKPWNLYIRRHSALTDKSTILKEHVLRQHAGWSPSSQMHLKYLHYFGNESNDSLLEAYGVVTKDKQLSDVLRPKQCPNCNEPNKPDSKFCAKCRMVLTYDAYSETVEEKQKTDSELQSVIHRMTNIENALVTIQPLLRHIKPELLGNIDIVDHKEKVASQNAK